MKKVLILILLLYLPVLSQFQSSLNIWRVVVVSTNYTNVYPRFSTLQNAFNSCVDSANDGKYFVINLATATQNITDYTSAWKDSILAHDPYMKLTSFGQAINDSIIGVTIEEFDLIAGIISLDGATAGDGLYFDNHQYKIRVTNYLGNALYIDTDSLKLRVQVPLYFTPNLLGIKVSTNSGIRFSDSVYIVPYREIYTDNDTLLIRKSFYFTAGDSLALDWNTQHFNLTYGESPAINVKLDSGLTASADGIRAWLDNARVTYTSAGRITLPSTLAGTGLIWTGDSLNVGLSYQFQPYNDSLWIDFNTRQFELLYGESPSVNIALDSGMTYASSGATTGIKPKIDYATLIFNSLLQLVINPTFAGGGLLITTGVMDIIPNEYAKIENDTLKIKTSYTHQFYGDSLTSLVTSAGAGVLPYDTTGVCVLYKGKIKRITYTYQLSGGNDTVITTTNNVDVNNNTDKIRCVWVNGSSQMNIQIWTLASRTWSNAVTLSFPNFADNYWRVVAELYAEAL